MSVISIASGRRKHGDLRNGEYVLVELELPGSPRRNIGVLLLDPEHERLYVKIRSHWEDVTDPDDVELLTSLTGDFEAKIREMGGANFLHTLEDTLSNTLQLSERTKIQVTDWTRALEELYEEHVETAEIKRYVTHLPLYSLKAAATRFGEEREVEEESWIRTPPALRLSADMFVARVVGRSMEPRIPDGSLCVFRGNLVGSRQGKLVLVERFGTAGTSARYTIKKYTSKKIHTLEGEWQHAEVRLEPLNKEFESFELKEGECRVIAEFVQVLE